MRILSIGNFYNPSWDGSLPDEEHIAGALEELGHEVVRWQRENLLEGEQVPEGEFDFTLVSQYDRYPSISHLPRPIVYFAFDYQADGQEWHERLVAEADLYLSKRIADSKYSNWQWLSQDFAPSFLDRHNPDGVRYDTRPIDVLFTGSYLPWAAERNATLKAVDEKFNLVIHSVNEWPGFKDQRGPIMDEGLPELYQSAKIVLSIDHTLEAGYWSDRNAQIMACGGFVLFRYIPFSVNTFSDGVAYFYSVEDCLEKIDYYLNSNEGKGKQILTSVGGYTLAHRELMVRSRVLDLLTVVRSIL